MRAWGLFPLEAEWADRVSDAFLRHPELFLAVAVTEEELGLKLERGYKALKERLEDQGALVLDPRRASTV